jgi:FdhD protein
MAQKTRNIELTQVTKWDEGKSSRVEDFLAAEEPLEMRAGRFSLGVTLRTPGDDEELVAGFLFTEGIISRREQLIALRLPADNAPERNLVRVTLDPKVRLNAHSAVRRFSRLGLRRLWQGVHRSTPAARPAPPRNRHTV